MKASAQEDSVSSAIYAVAGAVLIVGLLAAFAWLPRLIHARESEQVGKDAPVVKVPLVLNAEQLAEPPSLAPTEIGTDELKGHAVVLDFWATWCPPCKAEMPIIDRVAARYKSRGLVVVGINTSDNEGAGAAWAKSHNISYPIAFDSGPAAQAFGVEQLPTIVIISKTGKVVARRTGVTDAEELERLVNQAL